MMAIIVIHIIGINFRNQVQCIFEFCNAVLVNLTDHSINARLFNINVEINNCICAVTGIVANELFLYLCWSCLGVENKTFNMFLETFCPKSYRKFGNTNLVLLVFSKIPREMKCVSSTLIIEPVNPGSMV